MTGGSDAPRSVYEAMFEMQELLCQRYTALTPFILRDEPFAEVMELVARISNKELRKDGGKKGDKVTFDDRGNRHIWREAPEGFIF